MKEQDKHPRTFRGASKYVLDEELAKIVNVSIALEMPLLLKGEPGTGKTMLAYAIAESLGMPLITLNVKSSMKLVEALYQYDTLTRLNDSRFGDSRRDVSDIEAYIRMGKIGQSFVADEKTVLLIDEIDKADSDFQDDMLDVLDQMSFDIIEIDKTVKAKNRPVVIITSNAKKDLGPLPGALQLPPHRLSRAGDDAPDRGGPLPEAQRGDGAGLHPDLLPAAGDRRRREETRHAGAHQLDPGPAVGPRFPAGPAPEGRGSLPGGSLQEERRPRAGRQGHRALPSLRMTSGMTAGRKHQAGVAIRDGEVRK